MTQPFLRRVAAGSAAAATPDGWIAQPAGNWRGREVEVVFDPRRHDVLLHRGAVPKNLSGALVACGWRRRGSDAASEWWTRDRVDWARRRLRSTRVPGRERSIA